MLNTNHIKLYLLGNMGLKHHGFIQQNTYAIIFKKYLPMISPPSHDAWEPCH